MLVCPPAAFRAQLDALVRAGYTTISPDQYLSHLVHGAAVSPRPVLLTFDDAQASQVTVDLPEVKRRGLSATFFIKTVVLDQPSWMIRADLRHLSAAGMTIAARFNYPYGAWNRADFAHLAVAGYATRVPADREGDGLRPSAVHVAPPARRFDLEPSATAQSDACDEPGIGPDRGAGS
ncbi:MAG: hypothetical protein ABJA87_08190 [bacterium]